MTNPQELPREPCPFCGAGGPARGGEVKADYSGAGSIAWEFMSCDRCGARGPTAYDDGSEDLHERALSLWNKRVSA